MILFAFVFVFLFLLAFLTIVWVFYPYKNSTSIDQEPVSVIIPFKNNLDALIELCQDLKALNYSKELEFILVNDGEEAASNKFNADQGFSLINNKGKGKKAAIETGVNAAKYNWMWQLDADVRIHPNALIAMWHKVKPSTGMVLGPVGLLDGQTPYKAWVQNTEWILLQWVTALSTLFKKPFLANGANLLYRKEIFHAYNQSGFGKEYESGDDVFLLNYCDQNFSQFTIEYAKNNFAVVYTEMAQTETTFLEQRKRWLGKMEHKGLRHGKVYQILFLGIPFLSLLSVVLAFSIVIAVEWCLGIIFLMAAWSSFLGYLLGMFWNKTTITFWLFPFLFYYPFVISKALKE